MRRFSWKKLSALGAAGGLGAGLFLTLTASETLSQDGDGPDQAAKRAVIMCTASVRGETSACG